MKANTLLKERLDQHSVLARQIKQFASMRKWRQSSDANNLRSWRGYHPTWDEFRSQTSCQASLILAKDRDPLDIVLRRTQALLKDILNRTSAPKLDREREELAKLLAAAKTIDPKDADARLGKYHEACKLRRRIAIVNPLLGFDKMLFVKRPFLPFNEHRGDHMVWQRYGRNACPDGIVGGLYICDNVFSKPTVRNMLEKSTCANGPYKGKTLPPGGFHSPSLSYDARSILFSFAPAKDASEPRFHIFRVGVDGKGLTQLTDGPYNDFDPCWLPSGRIAFISERRGGTGRCFGNAVLSYTLASMNADGSDIVPLSYHETNEWSPAVNRDGMLVYTRWDYIDRGFNQGHHPWITAPDGRDARDIHGNYRISPRIGPHMEMNIQPIPKSRKYMAVATGHHYQSYGSLILIAPSVPDDNRMAPVKRFTPEAMFPEAESPEKGGPVPYATPWPLDEKYCLTVYDARAEAKRGMQNNFGAYLVDAFGNKELLWRDPEISLLSPIALQARPAPPVVPHATSVGVPPGMVSSAPPGSDGNLAEVTLLNVYNSRHPWPKDTVITALRIYQLFPRTPSAPRMNDPKIGYASGAGARAVLGTVPVETDGSARFMAPTKKLLYVQALDRRGLAVQSMRSGMYFHPGEKLTCQGCHESRQKAPAPAKRVVQALKRAPSKIKPDVEGSNPFSFPILVQPVLERVCVPCHKKKPKAPDLTKGDWGAHRFRWYKSYENLDKYAFFYDSGNRTSWNRFVEPETIPGKFGARASLLFKQFEKGHNDVKLSPADLHRITLWLDSDSNYFGSYENPGAQSNGEIVKPTLD